jgi:CRP-like cAMP-binding protein
VLTEMPLEAVRDRALLLRALGTFSDLDDDALATIAEHARLRRYVSGDVLAIEGEPVREVHIVVSGRISSRREGRLIAISPRGRGVGLLALLAGEPSTAVAAEESATTLEIPAHAVRTALEDSFSMTRNVLRNLARGLVRKRGDLPTAPGGPPPELGVWRDEPPTIVETVLRLRARGGPLARTNLDGLFALAGSAREIRPEPGDLLWKLGEPSSYLARIQYGNVRCTAADGRSVVVGANFVLGALDALAGVPRSYEARAETKIIAYRTSVDAYLGVLESYFDLARALVADLARTHLQTPEGN